MAAVGSVVEARAAEERGGRYKCWLGCGLRDAINAEMAFHLNHSLLLDRLGSHPLGQCKFRYGAHHQRELRRIAAMRER